MGGTTDLGVSKDSFWVGILSLLNTGSVTSGYCCLAYTRGSEFVTRFQEGTLSMAVVRMERSCKKDIQEGTWMRFADLKAKDPNRPYFLALSKN